MLTLETRTDLEFALLYGSPTRFSTHDVLAGSVGMLKLSEELRKQYTDTKFPMPNNQLLDCMSTDLQTLLTDVTDLAKILNEANTKARPRLIDLPFHDNLLLLGYRLVETSTLGRPRPLNYVDNVVHLGLIAFILSFLRSYDLQIPHAPLLNHLICLTAEVDLGEGQQKQELLLWLLFIGSASVLGPVDYPWLIPKATEIIQALALQTWEDAVRILIQFPWVHPVHDKNGQQLWNKSFLHRELLAKGRVD